MVKVIDIIATIDSVLQPAEFEDVAPNGLQVPGADDVGRLITGVSATLELLERAVEMHADLVIVHHGLFWSSDGAGLTRRVARRLRPLLLNDIGLAAYHLPLDAHPRHGNNALIAEGLGSNEHREFGTFRGRAVGRAAVLPGDGLPAPELFERVARLTGRRPLVFDFGPERVRTVGIVSGAAASNLDEAIEQGLDAFITGEPREHVMADAREAGIHFVAAGHYATETFGVRRLGELLADRHGIEHLFVDLPNPV